ncbi:MAG: hypothetical protein Q8K92_08270 [Leadbetterella sp.]|nr:hypothetical protein [Leadbetterella sp.]
MGNVFKSVAKFLDNALSGGEVDVIVMDASAPLSNQADVADTGDASTSLSNQAGAADEAANGNEDSSNENALDNAGDASADGDAGESENAEAANADGANGGESANANASAETASMPSVQQMLGEGQVAVDAAELESLRVDAAKWKENATELENLKAWKEAGSKENVLQGAVDAADAVGAATKKVSAATQKAIDLKNKMAGN